jgi:phage FluMu protein Com
MKIECCKCKKDLTEQSSVSYIEDYQPICEECLKELEKAATNE